jgi:hypothetical protein
MLVSCVSFFYFFTSRTHGTRMSTILIVKGVKNLHARFIVIYLMNSRIHPPTLMNAPSI